MGKNPYQYSNSKISTFEQCKLKYEFRYIKQKESVFDTVEAFMGSRVHESLEKLYKDLQMTILLTPEELLSFYNGIWEKNWNDNVHIVKQEYTQDDYRQKGEQCLKDFYKRYAPFNQDKTVGLEKTFRFNLNEKYTVFGIIDRIAKTDDGTFAIHDYKTSNTLPTQEQIDADRQLSIYRLGVKSLWPDVKEIKLVYHYLTFNEELSPSRCKTLKEEQGLKEELLELIRQIESTEEFPAESSVLCDWCEYQMYCPKRKHFFLKIDSFPGDLFQQEQEDNGVQLVNEYANLYLKKEMIEQNIEEIKNRIVQYAKKENLEAINGSNYKIYVKSKIEESFPRKDDPGRKELEEFLKESAKWEDVSILWISFLNERLKSGGWSPELIDKIKSFQIEKENSWVSKPYKRKKF